MARFDPVKAARELERRHALERENLKLQIEAQTEKRLRSLQLATRNKSGAPRVHLVIGDAHAKGAQSLERFTWLGKMIADLEPDVVIDIGDSADMESIASYDDGKATGETRRYWRDLEAHHEARHRINEAADGWDGAKVYTVGNHENRITKHANSHPRLHGTLGMINLKSEEYGWNEIPFLEHATIDGVTYSHYFRRPGSEWPLGGVNPGRAVILEYHISAVWGHSHRLNYYEKANGHGARICAMNVGCYFQHSEGWAGRDVHQWRRGIAVLRDVHDGSFSPEWWDMERIRKRYGA